MAGTRRRTIAARGTPWPGRDRWHRDLVRTDVWDDGSLCEVSLRAWFGCAQSFDRSCGASSARPRVRGVALISFLVQSGFLPYPPNNEAPRKLTKLDIDARVLTRTDRSRATES